MPKGFWRSLYGILGYEYNSINDNPTEKDVKLKQVCMRQISLSRVKLKKIERNEQIRPDLEIIKQISKQPDRPQLYVIIPDNEPPAWYKKNNI